MPADPSRSRPAPGDAGKIKKLPAAAVGYPRFATERTGTCNPFALTSHQRAREALEFGLPLDGLGFNIFVLGEERSGRMTSTLTFLESHAADKPTPDDWLYLNNFQHPNRPQPFRLPAGRGRKFRNEMDRLIARLRTALKETFQSEDFKARIKSKSEQAHGAVNEQFAALQEEAHAHGLEFGRNQQGQMTIMRRAEETPGDDAKKPDESKAEAEKRAAVGKQLSEKMARIANEAGERQAAFASWVDEFSRSLGDQVVAPYLDALSRSYGDIPGLARWLTALHADLLDHLQIFFADPGEDGAGAFLTPERRYTVNLLVEHGENDRSGVILEANPTYENLFGRIEYEQIGGHLHTDYRMIQAGSLHRANGGVLVVRAEAIAGDANVWTSLKGALRDREIRIEEIHRANNVPIAGAPRPEPIPLDVKVVIVGSPQWYYTFFSLDPDFRAYFKIKADIDPDMEASPANVACYAALIEGMVSAHGDAGIEPDALSLLLGEAARLAGHREKLSARFEIIADIVRESLPAGPGARKHALTRDAVKTALDNRRRRNARIEDRIQEIIARGMVAITTTGTAIGQINALTVRDQGDYSFGAPARITARASVGRRGAINIERDAELGGPIQQKGMMVLQGFLAGRFAQDMPVSFDCSVTFEQSYGGVEGDSASMAELLAILSDLADVPLRQDLAITGSVDQFGTAQAIGGVTQKIEGFYRTCLDQGGLTGSQGVVVPAANESQIVLRDDVADAAAAGKFHVYVMRSVEEALELFTGTAAGTIGADGRYPPDSVFGRAAAQLEAYDRILAERNIRAG